MRRERPLSLVDESRFFSKDECAAITGRILNLATGGGTTLAFVNSQWDGQVRWARNRTSLASDRRSNFVVVRRVIDGAFGAVTTSQTDDEALTAAVRAAERLARIQRTSARDEQTKQVEFDYPNTKIWSDASYSQSTDARAQAVAPLMTAAEDAGLLSAGFFSVTARASSIAYSESDTKYAAETQAECSTTVRDKTGTGSGWAGASSYDLTQVTPGALGDRALRKCLTSRNPVGIEPGRYTLIMEPQAAFDLARVIFTIPPTPDRSWPEFQGGGPWYDRQDPATGLLMSKLGQRVLDERLTVEHDPTDPLLGLVPFAFEQNANEFEAYRPVKWVDRGVLMALDYHRRYALQWLNENEGLLPRATFRMSGGTTSVEEMIRTTKRGLLVTRFWNVGLLDLQSLLCTGLTRDGLWLIENGEITHPVKNLRFTESPLFAFNSIEQLGVPEPIFSPGAPAIVPPVKVRDFSFTSLVDAI